jgi:hypothetical protein
MNKLLWLLLFTVVNFIGTGVFLVASLIIAFKYDKPIESIIINLLIYWWQKQGNLIFDRMNLGLDETSK